MSEITESSLLIVGGTRPRGRPRASEPKSPLTTWVPASYHDRLSVLALKHDVSVSKVVCILLDQALKKS